MRKTAFEMRISDWSSDVCSSLLPFAPRVECFALHHGLRRRGKFTRCCLPVIAARLARQRPLDPPATMLAATDAVDRSEEHTSELQSLMRISYAVFCLKKKKQQTRIKRLKKSKKTN